MFSTGKPVKVNPFYNHQFKIDQQNLHWYRQSEMDFTVKYNFHKAISTLFFPILKLIQTCINSTIKHFLIQRHNHLKWTLKVIQMKCNVRFYTISIELDSNVNYSTNKQRPKLSCPKYAATAFLLECSHCWRRHRMVSFLALLYMIEKPDEKIK